jgi:hypothetical protein
MSQRIFALLLTLGLAVPVLGQTAADLGTKHRRLNAYEVGPDILMTAPFAADGQVCEMALEPRRYLDREKTDRE